MCRYVLHVSTDCTMQVLLVTGGSRDNRDLDSTEVLEAAVSSAWRLAGPLPSARRGLRAASLSSRILVTGEEVGGWRLPCLECDQEDTRTRAPHSTPCCSTARATGPGYRWGG